MTSVKVVSSQPKVSEQQARLSGKTIPMLFLERVKREPEGVAFRYKELGIYREVTWGEYWEHVENFCLGLLELGLQQGDRVALMGEPCPEWMYADLATQSAGAIGYGIYSTSSPSEVHYMVETVGAKFFVAETQEYVDKILPIADDFPDLTKIIVIETKAMFLYHDPRLISFAEVEEIGKQKKAKVQFRDLILRTKPSDIAFLIFTSGTTGPAKAAMLSHENVITAFIQGFGEVFPELWTHEHRIVTHLSMAHIIERGLSIYLPMVYHVIPHIGETVEYLQETLYEVQPTFFHGVPRIWEKVASQIVVGIYSSSWIKKLTYRWAMNVSRRYMRERREAKKTSLTWRWLRWLAFQVAFRPILHKAGLTRAKYALSTGAPLPKGIQALWQTWGVDMVNLYGATETGGIISSQRSGFPRPGEVGKPTSFSKTQLATDGEIMVSGPGVFIGYWNNEKATQECKRGKWLYMGEIGQLTEDGNLKLVDRKRDIMITAGGKNITPTEIENALKCSPYISEAIVFADGRKFPSALIEIDFDTVAEWARSNKMLYTGFTSLATHEQAYKLIGEEVRKANQQLARVEQVKKFRIIPQELDPEEGDTTPTRKIKRAHTYEMFKGLIEEMYTTGEEELLLAEEKFLEE